MKEFIDKLEVFAAIHLGKLFAIIIALGMIIAYALFT